MALFALPQSVFSIIPQIGSVFGLIAFIAAVILYILRTRSRNELDIIKSAKDSQRAGLIKDLADKYSIPTNKISSDQQYDLLQRKLELDYRKRNQVFIFLGFLTIALSVIIVLLIVNETKNSNDKKSIDLAQKNDSINHADDSASTSNQTDSNSADDQDNTGNSSSVSNTAKNNTPSNLSASFTNIEMGSTLKTTTPLLKGIVKGPIQKGYSAYAVILFGKNANYLSKLTLKEDGSFSASSFLGIDGKVTLGIILCDQVASGKIARNLANDDYSIPMTEGKVDLLESVTVFVDNDPSLHSSN
jgi:hypothetical protein